MTGGVTPLRGMFTPRQRSVFPDGRPPRILLTTDWFSPAVNGVVMSVLTLQRELQELGCQVRILTLANGMRSSYADGVYRLGSVPSLLYDRARIGVLRHDRIHRQILAWRPDVIHSHCEFTTFVWAKRLAALLDAPLIHTYHTIYEDYTHYYSPSRTMGKRMVAAFSRRVLASADSVIAPTGKVSHLLRSYRVTSPITVIPTGLDLSRFCPAETVAQRADADRLRRQLAIASDQHVLLSVSRLAKEKSIDELLRLLAQSRDRRHVLVLVGDGPSRQQLEELASELGVSGQVRFIGCVPPAETVRYYRMADVFVSASRSETQGLTYHEALACGLPLLCRSDPALEGVVVDGVTGWQYRSAQEFRANLAAILNPDARRRLALAAAEHAVESCGAESFGRAVLGTYRQIQQERYLRRQLRVLTA